MPPANVQQLTKPVTIYIQHCVDLKPGEKDKLSFVVAKEGAATFELLPGGVFSFKHNYGNIDLDSFSWLGIRGQSELSNTLYCGCVYYVNINPSTTTMRLTLSLSQGTEICLSKLIARVL